MKNKIHRKEVNMKKTKSYICYAIGNRGLRHAWRTGPTKEEAKKQCKLAVKESIDDNPSKVRHAPFSYEIYEAVDCKT